MDYMKFVYIPVFTLPKKRNTGDLKAYSTTVARPPNKNNKDFFVRDLLEIANRHGSWAGNQTPQQQLTRFQSNQTSTTHHNSPQEAPQE